MFGLFFSQKNVFTQSDGRRFQTVPPRGATAGQNTREKDPTTKRTLIREITRIRRELALSDFADRVLLRETTFYSRSYSYSCCCSYFRWEISSACFSPI